MSEPTDPGRMPQQLELGQRLRPPGGPPAEASASSPSPAPVCFFFSATVYFSADRVFNGNLMLPNAFSLVFNTFLMRVMQS